ncbi:hypothetical protein U9M48_022346 [Paspalum notatum var. saurae]|uniref:BHLH domain-containing protein n=1 Tax=Paspalum notatum var. saurae TaxID=547442 RepID=A0AAQ3TLP7_PASNO
MSALVDALCAPPSGDAALIYDTFNATSCGFLFDGPPAAAALCDGGAGIVVGPAPSAQQQQQQEEEAVAEAQAATSSAPTARTRKRRRRVRACKSREETETQRMTHIAVERNRRRQMNEYLAVLRSLMPEACVQRGDQASIVGGAIEFVKELEQQVQCLEAQQRTLLAHQHHGAAKPAAAPTRAGGGGTTSKATAASTTTACVDSAATAAAAAATTSNCSSSVTEDAADYAPPPPPFAQFFTYPQYVWCQSPREPAAADQDGRRPGVADIEVTLVETHASLRVMTRRRPGHLLSLVTGLRALRLGVLHLSVTTLDALVLYSISVRVEEGCGLATVEDIAAAVHHVLCIIDAEATEQHLLTARPPH